MIALTIELRDTLTPRLRKLVGDSRHAVQRGVSRATLIMEREWKRKLSGPGTMNQLGVRVGQLRASVTHQFSPDGLQGTVGSNHPAIRIHEYGGVILPKRGEFLRFEIAGRVIFARSVTMPRRPHLAPAWAEAQAPMRAAFEKSVREALA